ncbi:erythromycin esterase [Asanoa ishikariensis]|uniref:Erythromycin esterase homolog n=1 Tax=Asanoa ishikariensis TaxID=137265 RepID=A0A1H3QYL6_9ACTN|nr:erythromycin esterase family protein [Asanoa ishikariensis]GIF64569.1 erythromycin esterase [Asanoa ishikariensis]SDZ18682.1 Erythromycin esterase homolog [Asanoa ishikariensis]
MTVSEFLATRDLLALGEPTHGEPAFAFARNEIFQELVSAGFRSFAYESDRLAALAIDAYVQGATDELPTDAFSHGFGTLPGNPELLEWLRLHNLDRPLPERVTFHGFDAPLEMTGAPSPRRYLVHVLAYLSEHVDPPVDLDELIGADTRWADPSAIMDHTRSVGRSPEALRLRGIADDLRTALYANAPRLVAATSLAEWRRADLHADVAVRLLGYHAEAAAPAPQAARTSRLLGVRDAWMAQNLLEIRAQEQHRGPTLVYANNRHLQRHPSTWNLAGMNLEWSSAGSIVAALLGDRYAVIIGSLGASAALNLSTPPAGTFEAALPATARTLLDRATIDEALNGQPMTVRTDMTPEQGYFPLDQETIAHCDAILHISS